MGKRNIFTALQRNVNKENNIAEQHLIDMLCMRLVFVHFMGSGQTIERDMILVASTAKTSGASEHWNPHGVAYPQ